MARIFKRKDRMHAVAEINITSLLDIVFCLLLIFMITTPLLEQTIPINLPAQLRDARSERPEDVKYQALSINRAGELFWGENMVSATRLQELLAGLSTQENPPVISLRGDGEVQYQKVIDVVDMLKRANLTKITFDTQVK